MDLYTFSLALGGVGLGVMAIGGVGHHGHAGHAHGHAHDHGGHAGHGHGHIVHGQTVHGHVADSHGHAHGAPDARANVLAFLSPRVLFTMLVGFGATGALLRPLVGQRMGGVVLVVLAAAGALLFEKAVVGPLWNFFFRFASAPALTLESAIADEARAASSFDARGQGLVAVELDGQVVQVLGTLRPEDRAAGVRVRAGDRLRVEDVDSARNRCTVSPLTHRV